MAFTRQLSVLVFVSRHLHQKLLHKEPYKDVTIKCSGIDTQPKEDDAPHKVEGNEGDGPPADPPGNPLGPVDEIDDDDVGHDDSQHSRQDVVRGDMGQDGPFRKKDVCYRDNGDVEDVAPQEAPDGHIEGPPLDEGNPHCELRQRRDHGEHEAADK